MAKVSTDYGEVLRRAAARLIDQIPELAANCCFVSYQTSYEPPSSFSSNDRAVVIHPSPGNYPMGEQEGAGNVGAQSQATITASLWVSSESDQYGRLVGPMESDSKGYMSLAKSVMTALGDHMLLDSGGDEILDVPCKMESFSFPEPTETKAVMQINFYASFHWDI